MTDPVDRSWPATFFFYLFTASMIVNGYLTLRRISDEALLTQLRADLKIMTHRQLLKNQIDQLKAMAGRLEAQVASLTFERTLERAR